MRNRYGTAALVTLAILAVFVIAISFVTLPTDAAEITEADNTETTETEVIEITLEKPVVTADKITDDTGNRVELQWEDSEFADTYLIARMASYNNYYEYYEVNEPLFIDEDVSENSSYRYQVQAIHTNEDGSKIFSSWSASRSVSLLPRPVFKLSNKSNGIRMEWQEFPNATKYLLYIKKSTDTNWQSYETTNTYYPFLGAEAGTTYYFQLRYLQQNKVYSLFSNVKAITHMQKEKLTSVTSNDSAVYLKWRSDDLAEFYVIERTASDNSDPVTFTVTRKNTYTDTPTDLDTTYYYRVCAVRYETDPRKMHKKATGVYSDIIRINPRAFKMVKLAESRINMGGLIYCQEMGNINGIVPWCVFFCGWCMEHSGYDIKEYQFPDSGNVGVWCDNLKKLGRFEVKEKYTPEQGDLIIFGYGPYNRTHIGLVSRVVDGYVYTIEGNTNTAKGTVVKGTYNGVNTCLMKRRKLNDSYIYGYGKVAP